MSTNPDDKIFFHHLPNPIVRILGGEGCSLEPIVRILGGKGGSLEPGGRRSTEDYVHPHRQDLFAVHKTSTFEIQGTFGTPMRGFLLQAGSAPNAQVHPTCSPQAPKEPRRMAREGPRRQLDSGNDWPVVTRKQVDDLQ